MRRIDALLLLAAGRALPQSRKAPIRSARATSREEPDRRRARLPRVDRSVCYVAVLILAAFHHAAAQVAPPSQQPAPKRILGLIPNYRTSPSLKNYRPLTPIEKFKMASQDSLDRGTFIMAALFASEAQWTKATPSFGQESSGYARYLSTSYADFAIGNFMSEAIYPTIFKQDPRYFRRGTGSIRSRLLYAITQTFWTHKDSGGMGFNFSECIGNSTGVAISDLYYPDNRNASDGLTKLGMQIGVDMAGNILKEFSPELNRVFSRRRPH